MGQVFGVEFSDSVLPLIERVIDESKRLLGYDCFYAVDIPELRGALKVATSEHNGSGVFTRIRPTSKGATVIRSKHSDYSKRRRDLTDSSIPDILSDLPSWIADTRTRMEHATQKAKSPKNAPWSQEELILALDLYFRVPPWTINKDHPAVAELSATLRKLSSQFDPPDAVRYRNANGVYMKLMNLQVHDPARDGRGLSGGGKREAVIWQQYGTDPEKLTAVATAIRAALNDLKFREELITQELLNDVEEAVEGRLLTRVHLARERSGKLPKMKKAQVLETTGNLRCEVCEFDFFERYGEHGESYIECHHVLPLHQLAPDTKTTLSDLALVCSNCHRMLHRRKKWLTLEGLRSLILQRTST